MRGVKARKRHWLDLLREQRITLQDNKLELKVKRGFIDIKWERRGNQRQVIFFINLKSWNRSENLASKSRRILFQAVITNSNLLKNCKVSELLVSYLTRKQKWFLHKCFDTLIRIMCKSPVPLQLWIWFIHVARDTNGKGKNQRASSYHSVVGKTNLFVSCPATDQTLLRIFSKLSQNIRVIRFKPFKQAYKLPVV